MKLVILHDSVKKDVELLNSLQSSCLIRWESEYETVEKLTESIEDLTVITHIAFIYHYPGYCCLPFYRDQFDFSKLEQPYAVLNSTYTNFSNNIVNLIGKFNKNIKIDILSCNLNRKDYIDEIAKIESDLEVDIRYSLNQTGNNPDGDWILESDGVDIRDIYFTENINNWNGLLLGSINGNELTTLREGTGDWNSSSVFITRTDNGLTGGYIYTLTRNIVWANIKLNNTTNIDAYNNFIQLEANDIFDGQGYTINLTVVQTGGIFATGGTSLANGSIVKNLGVIGGDIYFQGGFIIRLQQKCFTVQNCYSTGNQTGSEGGGIVGAYAGYNANSYCLIKNCYSTGLIGLLGGGIAGVVTGQNNGSCSIQNCYSTGEIAAETGGIVAVGAAQNGYCSIQNCYSTGNIALRSGGIVGFTAGEGSSGLCSIQNCYSTGSINGENAGGITGYFVANGSGTCVIQNCYSTGSINGADAGGICGSNVGQNSGKVYIFNSYCNGKLVGTITGTFYYNSTTVSRYDIPTLSLTDITNKIFTDNQKIFVSSGNIPATTKWDTSTIWQIPTCSTVDSDKYPRLRAFMEDINFNSSKYPNYLSNPPLTILKNQNQVILFSGIWTNNTSSANNNGSITLNPNGTGLTYSWNDNSTLSSRTNLSNGNYTVTITDGTSKTLQRTIELTLTTETILSGSINSQTNVSCNGGSNGSVTVAGSGSSDYQYQLNGGTYQSSGIFSGLSAGSYIVTIKDVNNCIITVPVTITQPDSALSGSNTSQTNVSCNGGSNGSVTVAGSGSSGYQYQLGSGTYQPSGIFSGLSAGSYIVTIKDVNNCIITVPVTITEPTILSGSITAQTNVLTYGESTGSVTIAGSGGTSPYQYKKNSDSNYVSIGTFSNLSAGSYVVTVKDTNQCTTTVPVTITQPVLELSGSISTLTNVSCNGGSNGSVTVVGSNKNNINIIYEYQLGSGDYQSSGTFNSLLAGSYVVTIREFNNINNTVTVPVTITQPTDININAISTNVTCKGQNNGSINLTVTGGTTTSSNTYTYLWSDNGITTQNRSGLSPNSYSVTVTDSNGCIKTLNNITITEPNQLITSISHNSTNILINTSGGTPNNSTLYTYNVNGSDISSNIFSINPDVSIYTIVVTDNNGCITTNTYQLFEATVTKTDVYCIQGSNGSITVNITNNNNSSGPYTFSLDGITYQSGIIFENLIAGSYSVRVKDSYGYIKIIPVNITEPTALSGTIFSLTNVQVYGEATGSVTIAGSGGTPPYEYKKNSDNNYVSSSTFSNLSAGSYVVTIRDANLCTTTVPVTITQSESELSGSISSRTNVSCYGGSNGSVTVVGTSNSNSIIYEYQLGSNSYQSSGTFNSLLAGSYVVTIRNSTNISNFVTVPVTITQPTDININAISTNVTCKGQNNGSINLSVTGGTTTSPNTYTYLWSDDGITTQNRSGLSPNVYSVTVTDSNGCIKTLNNITITEPNQLITSISHNSTNIIINTSGGITPYTYNVNGSNISSNTFSINPDVSIYTIVVTDNNGCITTNTYQLFDVIATKTDVSCIRGSNGSITVNITNNNNNNNSTEPYTFSLDGITYQSGNLFENLKAGSYSVRARDSIGYVKIIPVNITQPTQLVLSVNTIENISQSGMSDGKIIVSASGGSGGYSYSKDNFSNNQDNGLFENLGERTYIISVKDVNGCITNSSIIRILEPGVLNIFTTNIQHVDCYGEKNGSITVAGIGGTTPYTFSRNNINYSTNNTFTDLASGSYVIYIKDTNNVIKSTSITINQPPLLLLNLDSLNNLSSNTSQDGRIQVSATGGTGIYTYSKDGVNYSESNIFNNLTNGNYTIRVKDSNNCIKTLSVSITRPGEINLYTTNITHVTCFGASNGTIIVTATGGYGNFTYSLFNGSQNQNGIFNNLTAGTYIITASDGLSSKFISVILTQPNDLVITPTIINSEEGSSNGTVVIDVKGGSGDYLYQLNDGELQSSNIFTELGNEEYSITVQDNVSLCTNTKIITVALKEKLLQLTAISNTIVQNNPTVVVDTDVILSAIFYPEQENRINEPFVNFDEITTNAEKLEIRQAILDFILENNPDINIFNLPVNNLGLPITGVNDVEVNNSGLIDLGNITDRNINLGQNRRMRCKARNMVYVPTFREGETIELKQMKMAMQRSRNVLSSDINLEITTFAKKLNFTDYEFRLSKTLGYEIICEQSHKMRVNVIAKDLFKEVHNECGEMSGRVYLDASSATYITDPVINQSKNSTINLKYGKKILLKGNNGACTFNWYLNDVPLENQNSQNILVSKGGMYKLNIDNMELNGEKIYAYCKVVLKKDFNTIN